MKRVIKIIDRALKHLYRIEVGSRAEHFLIQTSLHTDSIGHSGLSGALFIRGMNENLSLGIYFEPIIRQQLETFSSWGPFQQWSGTQLNAFTVAIEEVSHFLYLIFHATQGRQLTQLELEIQGEIDKFLLTYFAAMDLKKAFDAQLFQDLLDRLFKQFRLSSALTEEQKKRYLTASHLARRFVEKYAASLLSSPSERERTFRWLRRYYRLPVAEKLGHLH